MEYFTPQRGDEAEAFLRQNPDLQSFELLWTSLSGVGRGKRLRREELVAAFENGRFLPISATAVDQTGQDVHETGLTFQEGDWDMVLCPVPHSLVRVPWASSPRGRYLATAHYASGDPIALDPRHVLARVVEAFSDLSLTPVCALELEFFLCDQESVAQGTPRPPKGRATGTSLLHHQPYSLQDLCEFEDFFSDLYAFAKIQNLSPRALISEYAPGQMEITLPHHSDALRAADEAVALKQLIKGTAQRHGMIATFMAKPYAHWSGNGLHIHVSCTDGSGNNIFATNTPSQHSPLRHAIGGLLRTMGEATLIFAPNPNSYRRLKNASYAPTRTTWGANNRTVSIRIPAGPEASCHIEHRVSGADANPYLALAAVLAGVHHGLLNTLDPGPETLGNGYAQEGSILPSNPYTALEHFRSGKILPHYMGDFFMSQFAMVKEVERDRFYEVPTQRDFDWYLQTT